MSKKLPDHIDGLVQYLSSPDEKANEDLILKYFRKIFGNEFTRQEEADRSDGYLPGHFVLELKGKTNDWLAGLFQGIAYRKNLDFSAVVVAAKGFLALWSLDDLGENLLEEIMNEKGAPSSIGKKLGQKYKDRKIHFLKKAAYQFPSEYLGGLLQKDTQIITKEIASFEKTIWQKKKVRHKITTKNFTTILKQMTEFFDQENKLAAARAFYSMVYGWDSSAVVEISTKSATQATVGGEYVQNLIPGQRLKFKEFVESHYIHVSENESIDDYFAQYDKALDAVDKSFRKKNGIFFTDLFLSKFVMWVTKKEVPNLGKDYLVIDPACGSGNLVTNWRSPLQLRHKVVSEIEPELLFAVEQRMKGDSWHNGKFTVIPKVSDGIGLNFIDKSASEYLATIAQYLKAKGQKADKPLAILCNPPYKNDDEEEAEKLGYDIHPTIVDLIGKDAAGERTNCFLAQMKLIAESAVESGLPGQTMLLLFTGIPWLTSRPVHQRLRSEVLKSFVDLGGVMVNSQEFFDVPGKFPIAFTMWRLKNDNEVLDPERPITLTDLTWMKRDDLVSINWDDEKETDSGCEKIIKNKNAQSVLIGQKYENIREWSGKTRIDFQREKTKDDKKLGAQFVCGLPKGDSRHGRKKTLGHADGSYVGFMDDLTPCRIRKGSLNRPWFRLNTQFMEYQKTRLFSGPPDNRGFEASDADSAKKLFFWYALGRTFKHTRYPMWANNFEMWGLSGSSPTSTAVDYSLAISYAENECIEVTFPSGNPKADSIEISLPNPMSGVEQDSFWNQELRQLISPSANKTVKDLIESVDKVFEVWKKFIKSNGQVFPAYKQQYLFKDSILENGAGLVQIRDYAANTSNQKINDALADLDQKLKKAKEGFFSYVSEDLKYFSLDKSARQAKVIATKPATNEKKGFDHIIDLRLALACKIVDEMNGTKEFSRVKFAKAFYLTDVVSGVDLKTEYIREAAGPLDQRSLYNEKIGIEPLAAKHGYFETEKKKGKEFDFIQYTTGPKLSNGAASFEKLFGKDVKKIESVINLTSPMTRDQIEIVATLYACWNDFLIANRKPTDQELIKEFKEKWHPEKTKKFKAEKNKKPRFTEKQLVDAIAWMKAKGLVPIGSGKKTKAKPSKDEVIPF